jgi:hypothetical protein
MRLPSQEHDPLLALRGAGHLGQHSLLGGLDHVEALQAEGVLVEHLLDQAVAVVARLDAVDLAVQLVLELGDISKALNAAVGHVLGHRERVLGTLEIDTQHLDRAVVTIRGQVTLHGRHPIAEKDVDVAVLQAGVGHGHRQHLRRRFVTQALEHDRGRRRRGGDIGPANVREAHLLAGRRIARRLSGAHRQHERDGARRQIPFEKHDLLCLLAVLAARSRGRLGRLLRPVDRPDSRTLGPCHGARLNFTRQWGDKAIRNRPQRDRHHK